MINLLRDLSTLCLSLYFSLSLSLPVLCMFIQSLCPQLELPHESLRHFDIGFIGICFPLESVLTLLARCFILFLRIWVKRHRNVSRFVHVSIFTCISNGNFERILRRTSFVEEKKRSIFIEELSRFKFLLPLLGQCSTFSHRRDCWFPRLAFSM